MSTLVCQPLVSGGTLVSLNPIWTFSFLQTSTKTISKLPPRSRSSSEDVDEKQRDLGEEQKLVFRFSISVLLLKVVGQKNESDK
jgi:hypothetical protein